MSGHATLLDEIESLRSQLAEAQAKFDAMGIIADDHALARVCYAKEIGALCAQVSGMAEALNHIAKGKHCCSRIGADAFLIEHFEAVAERAYTVSQSEWEKRLQRLVESARAVIKVKCYREDGLKVWHPDLRAALADWEGYP